MSKAPLSLMHTESLYLLMPALSVLCMAEPIVRIRKEKAGMSAILWFKINDWDWELWLD